MVYFAMIYDKKKSKKIFWHANCIYQTARKKQEAKMSKLTEKEFKALEKSLEIFVKEVQENYQEIIKNDERQKEYVFELLDGKQMVNYFGYKLGYKY
jgi:hypothetical protein